MNNKYFVITAFGPDRPGMVEQVTDVITHLRGNIEDATMTRLGGEFVMMLVVALSPLSGKWLLNHMPALQLRLRLNLNAKAIPAMAAHGKQAQSSHLISVYGTDRPGIVHTIASAIARRGLNITNLQTKIITQDRKPLYILLLELQIPSRAKAKVLEQELVRLRKLLKLDITLRPLDAVTL